MSVLVKDIEDEIYLIVFHFINGGDKIPSKDIIKTLINAQ